MSPPRTRLAVPAGGAAVTTVLLRNDGEASVHLQVALRDWTIEGGTVQGLSYHPPGTLQRSAAPFLQALPERLDLAPGESGEIHVSITLPDATAGSHFAALLVTQDSTAAAEVSGMQYNVQLAYGHLITIDTEGRTRYAAELRSFETSRPDDTGSLEITARLDNVGDAGLRPEGTFALLSERGDLVAKVPIPITFAQPGGSVEIVADLDEVLAPGRYDVVGTIDLGGGKFLTPELELEVVDEIEIADVEIRTVEGRSAVTLRISNPGNVTHSLAGRIEVRDEEGTLIVRRETGDPLLALPGAESDRTFDLGELPAGRYVAQVELADGERRLETSRSIEVPALAEPAAELALVVP